ncbi:MFS transporter [Evansella tamaricis]|uniref:MFS transporter n=1 Tax=Evansella tamaricis TaxID=2069301 RepID=A0ABS6JG39_9BACI|nr:MFS transporter [Evansella tamaricis]MBU9712365.1 MFS transporter [Evansella tamaricis]
MLQSSVWKLKGFLFFFHSSMTILVSYMPIYFQSQGLSGSQIGSLLAIGPAAAIIAQPFWGFMSDKWKTVKRVLLICLTSALGAGFLLFQMTEFFLLMAMMTVFFSFTSPVGGLGDSLAQKVSVRTNVSFGSIRMWGSLGFGISSLVGGYIFAIIGIGNIYYVYAFFLVIAALFCFLSPDSAPSKKPVQLINALKLAKNGKLALFLAMILTISLTHRMNDSFIGLFIIAIGGSESYIGWAWFIGVLTEAAVFAFSYYWLKQFHPLTLIHFAAILYTIRWILMSVVPDPNLVLAIQVLHGICFGIFYLTAFQFVGRLIPEELESTGHLLFIAVFFGFAGVIGSILGGNIIDLFNPRTLYMVMTVFSVIGVFGSFIYRAYYFRSDEGKKELEKLRST